VHFQAPPFSFAAARGEKSEGATASCRSLKLFAQQSADPTELLRGNQALRSGRRSGGDQCAQRRGDLIKFVFQSFDPRHDALETLRLSVVLDRLGCRPESAGAEIG